MYQVTHIRGTAALKACGQLSVNRARKCLLDPTPCSYRPTFDAWQVKQDNGCWARKTRCIES